MYDVNLVINETAPDSLSLFRHRECIYGLGSSQNLVISSARLDMYKSSFSFYGAKCWNSKPEYINENKANIRFSILPENLVLDHHEYNRLSGEDLIIIILCKFLIQLFHFRGSSDAIIC